MRAGAAIRYAPLRKSVPAPSGDTFPQRAFPRAGASNALLAAVLTAVLFSAVLFSAVPARAVPPKYFEVSDAHIVIQSGDIIAKLSIDVDNPTGLFEMLKDGASIELEVTAKLERPRTLWTNVTLAEAEFTSTLQHNPLTREFALYMPGESKPLLDRNLERLLAATWHKFTAMVGTTDALDGDKDTEYRVTLTLILQHAKPPPWLIRNSMFWSKKILDPETIELPFRY